MVWGKILGGVFILLVVFLLFYIFMPFSTKYFTNTTYENNFSLDLNASVEMQFYENMRFPDKSISYKIEDCTLSKTEDMERAFNIVSNLTSLSFSSVDAGEEIIITCDEKNKIEGGMFIAGEGGPIKIIQSGDFHVILKGKILLIRDTDCANPNVALHELFHVLGFNHSENQNNIMYPVSRCDQEISDDMINLIDDLYVYESYTDLLFEDVNAYMHSKYLDTNISIRNYGLKDSEMGKILIYADNDLVKEMEFEPLDVGEGRKLLLTNIWVSEIRVDELKYVIEYDYPELDKTNNEIKIKE